MASDVRRAHERRVSMYGTDPAMPDDASTEDQRSDARAIAASIQCCIVQLVAILAIGALAVLAYCLNHR